MAIYRVQGPDGAIHRFEGPDDATPADVEAFAAQQFGQPKAAPEVPQASALGSSGENFLAGVGRGMTRAGLAVKQGVGMAGEAIGIPGAAGLRQSADASLADMEATDAELMGTGAGKFGSVIGSTAVAAPGFFIPGAQSVAGSALVGGTTGALLNPGSIEERGREALIGTVGGGGGALLGKGVQAGAKTVMNRAAATATAKATQNASRDAAAVSAKGAGYVLPPATVNPTKLNRAAEGFAGKITTAQQASIRNQEVTDRLVRESLGLAPDKPLNLQTMQEIRKEAGQAYAALDDLHITADAQYARALQGISSRQTKAAEGFPGSPGGQLESEVNALWSPSFTGGQATAKISLLRESARKAKAGGDGTLAKGLNDAANAIEDVIDRNLQATGQPQLLQNYRAARELIAKTYSVEKALNEGLGTVSARKLAAQLAKGKPLSGGLKTAAQAGQAFPKATAEVTESMPGVSPLDFAVGTMGAAAGSPAGLSLLVGRPMMRNALLSGPYQSLMTTPSYGPNALTRFTGNALQSRFLPPALAAVGTANLSSQ